MGEITEFKRGQIVGPRRSSASFTKTASLCDASRATVSRVMSAYHQEGPTTSNRINCGRCKRKLRSPAPIASCLSPELRRLVLKYIIGSHQQISPPSEHIVVSKPHRPWWERYQPISYNLCSRSGTEGELRDMISRCNDVGVKIYADVVINHMCAADAGEGGRSTRGSYFNASREEFPSVPYSAADSNDDKCTSGSGNIENYQDIYQVRNCRLLGLLDLAQEKEHVRGKIVDYLNALVDMGVAGFHVDACKHMWPKDLKVIYGRLHNLNPKWFPEGSRPLVYQEVIDLGDEPIKASEYYTLGLVTEFKYGAMLGSVFRKWNGYKLSDLRTWGEGWGLMPSDRALVFVDNHDNQRGHGAGGASILTFWEPRPYRAAVAFMLAHPYGMSRVMSSYRWDRHVVNGQDENDWVGPPINPDGSTKPVPINPDDGSCGDRWVCEHRWPQIRSEIYLFYNNYLN
uniref:Alpha-amylase n=1 Tax=Astyanax mexicanus TaxID=7994 RepID=A0A8B9H6H5_ASTMX